jgi:hypothetical protein
MRNHLRLACLAIGLVLIGTANAADPNGRSCWCEAPPHCCDDYCPKPLPAAPCSVCRSRDDYCSKPLPTVCGVRYFGRNDYCPKPLPRVSACWPPPWFTCGCGAR